jgi:hypothetical protein
MLGRTPRLTRPDEADVPLVDGARATVNVGADAEEDG